MRSAIVAGSQGIRRISLIMPVLARHSSAGARRGRRSMLIGPGSFLHIASTHHHRLTTHPHLMVRFLSLKRARRPGVHEWLPSGIERGMSGLVLIPHLFLRRELRLQLYLLSVR